MRPVRTQPTRRPRTEPLRYPRGVLAPNLIRGVLPPPAITHHPRDRATRHQGAPALGHPHHASPRDPMLSHPLPPTTHTAYPPLPPTTRPPYGALLLPPTTRLPRGVLLHRPLTAANYPCRRSLRDRSRPHPNAHPRGPDCPIIPHAPS